MDSEGMPEKQLVEAILEIRWQLADSGNNRPPMDPLYKLAVGYLYEGLKSDYPYHKQLPASVLPDELSAYVVQHQFRSAEDSWPLVQVGQGVFTLNDTQQYKWVDFRDRANKAMKCLASFYRENNQPIVTTLRSLRYINSIPFDYVNQDALTYLDEKMGISVGLNGSLMASCTRKRPSGFDLHFVYEASKPDSSELHLHFGTGTSADGGPIVLWETAVRSEAKSEIVDEQEIVGWASDAHEVAENIYFALVKGSKKE